MVIFMLLTWQRGEVVLHRAILSRPILIRAACETVGRLNFALALTLTSLSGTSAILQATPLIVVLGAAMFFGEQVGYKRWLTIFVGLIGVLMVIRPGLDGFEPASIFAVIAMLGFAGRDLATRGAPPVLSNMQLGVYGFFVMIPTGLIMLYFSDQAVILNTTAAAQIAGSIIFGVAAYYALTVAMRVGDVAVVAPFRYTRLVFALLWGIFIFGENPDAMTLAGSVIIVVSGGYTLVQSRRVVAVKVS